MTDVRPPQPGNFLFTSESVNEGHPDKLCDQVSDAVLDACLAQDPDSRVACESCSKTGMVMVFGEITTKAKVDYEAVVRQACADIGYDDKDKGLDHKTMEVLNKLEAQSAEIGEAVHGMGTKAPEEVGAGDQGHMFGYASDETPQLMPMTHMLATHVGYQLTKVRKNGVLPWLRPDGKTQITAEYKRAADGSMIPQRIHTILISTQHSPDVSNEQIAKDLKEHVIKPVVPAELIDEDTIYHLNPSGRFCIGGPHGDAGLTGRKIIIDTYGGWGAHGGGAFSGKDTTKVDRSAAYAARWAAKSLVANGFCSRCLVQVSYAIGVVQPLSMFVDSYESVRHGMSDQQLTEIVKRNFDFRPGCIQRDLDLKKPQFQALAAYGHFGRDDVHPAWESLKDLQHEVPAAALQGTLLGMGNPLLDICNEVDADYIKKYQLGANDQILAEDCKAGADKPAEIYADLAKKEGTLYVPGGATQNSIRVAQWQVRTQKKTGAETSFAGYMGCVGDDANGKKMEGINAELGVTTSYLKDASTSTGICGVLINDGAEGVPRSARSLVTDLKAANNYKLEHLEKPENWKLVEQAKFVYSAGFFMTVCPPAMLKVAEHCLAEKKTYCLNLSAPFLMQVPPFKKCLDDLMPMVDFLFGNETEAMTYAEVAGWKDLLAEEVHLEKTRKSSQGLGEIELIASKLSMLPSKKEKGRTVVITQGTLDTIVAHRGKVTTYPVIELDSSKVKDTNGAGDAYVGGFLARLVQGATMELCCKAGAEAACHIVQKDGCTFDTAW